MTTRATATLQRFADLWEALFASAVFSGIVGDTEHAQRGGYHISIADQVDPGNYSVVRPDDKAPPGTWPRDCASAVDMNLGLADMITCHTRLRAVFRARGTDPRARYVNAWNGWDSVGNAGRYDMVTGAITAATDDHKWHMHLEFRRRYVTDARATEAVLSILRGQSAADYLEELDMPTADEIATAVIARLDTAPIRNGRSLGGTLDALARTIVDERTRDEALAQTVATLAPKIAAAVVAALPQGTDPVSQEEVTTAVKTALRDAFAGPQP